MFGSKKESQTALSHRKVFALNAVLAALELIEGKRITPRDYAVFQSPLVDASDRSRIYFTRVAGHYTKGDDKLSSSFTAEASVRFYTNREPQMNLDSVGVVMIDDHFRYRVEWLADGRFRVQKWNHEGLVGGWWYSDELKRLDELGFSPRLENFLYAQRIRTLGHVLKWTSAQLREAGLEEELLEKLKKSLDARGYVLDAAH